MNEPPLPPKVDHPLDRRAALVAIGALQLAVLVLTPVIWKEIRGSLQIIPAYSSFVVPWAMSLACMIGFASAVYPTHAARRLLLGWAACLWVWSALFCGHNLAGETGLSRGTGSSWILNLFVIATFTAAIFLVLKRVWHLRLVVPGFHSDENARSSQFHLRDLMSAVLLICVTLAVCRLAGPIELPPTGTFQAFYVVDMATMAVMGACAILAAFFRKQALLFVLIFPSLVCFAVASILLMQIRVSQWAQYGPVFLKVMFVGETIYAAIYILTMLLFRWLGYRLEWERR